MLFPSDFLTRLEYLSIMSKRVFRGSLLAQRRSLQMGQGIEFSEHREYQPGDDLRYLDWNAYARHGDLLLKRFHEERDLHVCVMLDCSRSMAFGSPPRFDFGRQLAAALAYIALSDQDRISIVGFADGILAELPASRGKSSILSVMKFLEQLETTGTDTNLGRAVHSLLSRGSGPGLVVVISDLFDEHGFQTGLDQLRYRRFDTHVLQLYDPLEAAPNLAGDVEMIDMETGTVRQVTVTEKSLQLYRQLFEQHQQAVRDYCRRYSLGCTQSPANVSFDQLIMQMMRESSDSK